MNFLTNINVQFYIISYLIGGIPFGMILSKIFANINIKERGSKSIGTTNVFRVLKESKSPLTKKITVATFILDVAKGMVILFVASYIGLDESVKWAICLFVVLGHCFSPYLRLQGGKGIATGFGVMLYMLPIESLIGILAWAISFYISKISSLSSLISLVAFMSSLFIFTPQGIMQYITAIYIIVAIITLKHIPNIVRLVQKKEDKADVLP